MSEQEYTGPSFGLPYSLIRLSKARDSSEIDFWYNRALSASAEVLRTPWGEVLTAPSDDDRQSWYIFLVNNPTSWKCLITQGDMFPAGWNIGGTDVADSARIKAKEELRNLLRYFLTNPSTPGWLKELLTKSREALINSFL
jgi:hypothetical protein